MKFPDALPCNPAPPRGGDGVIAKSALLTTTIGLSSQVSYCANDSSYLGADDEAPVEPAKAPTAKKRKTVPETRSKHMPQVKLVHYSINPAWVLDYVKPSTGKPSNKTLGPLAKFTELDACILAKQWLAAIEAGADPFAGDLTVGEHFDQIRLVWAKQNKKSWKDDLGVFNRYIRRAIGRVLMRKVTTRDLQRLIDALRAGIEPQARELKLADGTVYQVIALLKGHFGSAWKAGEIPSNPAAALKQLKLQNHRRSIYSDEELVKIFSGLQAVNPLVRLLFVMLLGTGARISELLNARYADLDELGGTLYVRENKANRPFLMPLSPDVMAAVAELKTLARPGNPHLFPAIRGDGPMAPPRKAFQKVLAAAGIADRTFHCARRTAISSAVQAPGVSLLDASRMANHADTRITEKRYVVTGDARIRHAVNEVGKRLQLQMGLSALPRAESQRLPLIPTTRSLAVDDRFTAVHAHALRA